MNERNPQMRLVLEGKSISERGALILEIVTGGYRGRMNPIPMKELAGLVGVSPRVLQKEIEILILEHGKLIGSNCEGPYGYFLVMDEEDRKMVRENRMSRAISNFKIAMAFDKMNAVQEMEGQISMVVAG